MSDITTKLRSGEHGWLHELSEQAADEIDRLRAEIARLIAANGDLQRWFDAAFSEFTRKDQEIARLREVLSVIAYPLNISKIYHMDAVTQARAALAEVEGVGK